MVWPPLVKKTVSLKIICAKIVEEDRTIITIKNQLIKTCELFYARPADTLLQEED